MATTSVDIRQSPPLTDLVSMAEAGADIVLVDKGKEVARIVLVGKRMPGLQRGAIWASDDFDEPLPDSLWTGNA
jgi:antitoxin (DNA-binding transcriptional repressor) of toxin-antitoxin stability system